MKITRNQFLKLIPATALTLTGCGSKAQPANTESLVFSHHYKLDYAQQFTAVGVSGLLSNSSLIIVYMLSGLRKTRSCL